MHFLFSIQSVVFLVATVEMLPPPQPYFPQDYPVPSTDFQDPRRSSAVPSPEQLDGTNDAVRTGGRRGGCGGGCWGWCLCSSLQEIFNHVLDDLEIFLNKIGEATSAQEERSQKKKGFKKKKKSKKGLFLLKSPDIHEEPASELWFLLQLRSWISLPLRSTSSICRKSNTASTCWWILNPFSL